MKNTKVILSSIVIALAIAGAYATAALDPPVRGLIEGECRIINTCTIVARTPALCNVITDDHLYYAATDTACIKFPITDFVRRRISQ